MVKQLYCLEIGDNWHGKCGGIYFESKDNIYPELVSLVDSYCKNYGGSIDDWPLLDTFENGKVIHNHGKWICLEL